MTQLPKVLQSEAKIRFQDCDPYGHLYNAKYIDYFLNAREDQVLEAYQLDIYGMASSHGLGWVVGQNQIAYLQPANLMERVVITSKIIEISPNAMTVEFQMLNKTAERLKAFMWSRFVHFDLKQRKSIPHNDEIMAMLEPAHYEVPEKTFAERLKAFRMALVS